MCKLIIFAVIFTIFVSASLGSPARYSISDEELKIFTDKLKKNTEEYGITCENVDEKCKEVSKPYRTDDEDYEDRLLDACQFGYKEYFCLGRNKESDLPQIFGDMVAIATKDN